MMKQENSQATRTSKEVDVALAETANNAPDQNKDESPVKSSVTEESKYHYPWRFWVIFPALCITGFLSSLEGSLVTTAMPTLSRRASLLSRPRGCVNPPLGSYASPSCRY